MPSGRLVTRAPGVLEFQGGRVKPRPDVSQARRDGEAAAAASLGRHLPNRIVDERCPACGHAKKQHVVGWCEDQLDENGVPVKGCDAECWGTERMSA